MLRMGFIDDVEWILDQSPKDRQIALFSATMPQQIRRIAARYLNAPAEITIKVKTATADTIRQRYWPVQGFHKLDALTRILEAEPFDAMLIFVRTKIATADLSEKLEARGYASAPLNGDIQQKQRERTIERLKKGKLDIIVATDVAARGLDVQRISHVLNYDIPNDTEAYVHRIGRTGRAGREGDAILFVTPREKRMLYAIENATRKKIELMELPSTDAINNRRIDRFKRRITETLASEDLTLFSGMIDQYQQDNDASILQIAAALAQLSQGDAPFLLQNTSHRAANRNWLNDEKPTRAKKGRKERFKKDGPPGKNGPPPAGMERYRISVGHDHGIMPGNIVGAIANEADIDGRHIGRISIYDTYSLIDLPAGMPTETFSALKKVWVSGQRLGISRPDEKEKHKGPDRRSAPKGKDRKKKSKTSKRKPRKKIDKRK
jgi:ATP-dependent RNA helicase DeaD